MELVRLKWKFSKFLHAIQKMRIYLEPTLRHFGNWIRRRDCARLGDKSRILNCRNWWQLPLFPRRRVLLLGTGKIMHHFTLGARVNLLCLTQLLREFSGPSGITFQGHGLTSVQPHLLPLKVRVQRIGPLADASYVQPHVTCNHGKKVLFS